MASKMPSPSNKGPSRPNLVIHTGSTEPSQPQPQPQPQPPAPPSPVHEPLSWDMWWGRARHLCFGPKKEPNPTGVEARKDFGWLVLGGSLLCFVAGWVNAFAIIAASSTVSHMTGSTTKAGMALVEADGGYIAFAFMIWCVCARSCVYVWTVKRQGHMSTELNKSQ